MTAGRKIEEGSLKRNSARSPCRPLLIVWHEQGAVAYMASQTNKCIKQLGVPQLKLAYLKQVGSQNISYQREMAVLG